MGHYPHYSLKLTLGYFSIFGKRPRHKRLSRTIFAPFRSPLISAVSPGYYIPRKIAMSCTVSRARRWNRENCWSDTASVLLDISMWSSDHILPHIYRIHCTSGGFPLVFYWITPPSITWLKRASSVDGIHWLSCSPYSVWFKLFPVLNKSCHQ